MHDKTVCIIDDELAMRQSLESLVRSMGVRARLYASAEAFLEHGASGTSHCIVCDIQMAGMSGIELLAVLRGGCCDVPIIFVTAHPSARGCSRRDGSAHCACWRSPLIRANSCSG